QCRARRQGLQDPRHRGRVGPLPRGTKEILAVPRVAQGSRTRGPEYMAQNTWPRIHGPEHVAQNTWPSTNGPEQRPVRDWAHHRNITGTPPMSRGEGRGCQTDGQRVGPENWAGELAQRVDQRDNQTVR